MPTLSVVSPDRAHDLADYGPIACGECPDHHIQTAEYQVEWTGRDLDGDGAPRRELCCRRHLADLFDYAHAANQGFTPPMVSKLPTRSAVAA